MKVASKSHARANVPSDSNSGGVEDTSNSCITISCPTRDKFVRKPPRDELENFVFLAPLIWTEPRDSVSLFGTELLPRGSTHMDVHETGEREQ